MRLDTLGTLHELEAANGDLARPEALRARLAADGFVFLRSVVDVEATTRLRHAVIDVLAREGLAEPDRDRPTWSGIPRSSPDGAQAALRREADWRTLVEHASVSGVAELLLGETPFWGGVTTFRYSLPSDDPTLFLHQDANGLYGSPCLTFWLPLMDVDRELGGLAVVPGSQADGLRYHEPSLSVPDEQAPQNAAWHTTDFREGDVLVFGPLLVHSGLPNRTEQSIRLSVDARVQAASAPRPEYFLWTDRIGDYAKRSREAALAAGIPHESVQEVAYALRDRAVDLDDPAAVEAAIAEIVASS